MTLALARTIALITATCPALPASAMDTITAPGACLAHVDGIETVLTIGGPDAPTVTGNAPGIPTDAAAAPLPDTATETQATAPDTTPDPDATPDPDPALAALHALPACTPEDVLRHLTPELADGDRAAFCLLRAETEDGTPTVAGFSEGARDDALTCTEPTSRFCERVNASRDAALDIAGLAADTDARDTAGAAVSGIRSLGERAGATILTGTGGAVASTLGSVGASALAAVTAPVAIAAGVVSVVAVGGAVYVCK